MNVQIGCVYVCQWPMSCAKCQLLTCWASDINNSLRMWMEIEPQLLQRESSGIFLWAPFRAGSGLWDRPYCINHGCIRTASAGGRTQSCVSFCNHASLSARVCPAGDLSPYRPRGQMLLGVFLGGVWQKQVDVFLIFCSTLSWMWLTLFAEKKRPGCKWQWEGLWKWSPDLQKWWRPWRQM